MAFKWLSLYERAEEGDIGAVRKMFQSQFASASKLFPELLMKQGADEVVSLIVIFLLSASARALEVFAGELPNLTEIHHDILFGMYPTIGPSVHGVYRSFYTFTLDNGFEVVNQAIGCLICENPNKVDEKGRDCLAVALTYEDIALAHFCVENYPPQQFLRYRMDNTLYLDTLLASHYFEGTCEVIKRCRPLFRLEKVLEQRKEVLFAHVQRSFSQREISDAPQWIQLLVSELVFHQFHFNPLWQSLLEGLLRSWRSLDKTHQSEALKGQYTAVLLRVSHLMGSTDLLDLVGLEEVFPALHAHNDFRARVGAQQEAGQADWAKACVQSMPVALVLTHWQRMGGPWLQKIAREVKKEDVRYLREVKSIFQGCGKLIPLLFGFGEMGMYRSLLPSSLFLFDCLLQWCAKGVITDASFKTRMNECLVSAWRQWISELIQKDGEEGEDPCIRLTVVLWSLNKCYAKEEALKSLHQALFLDCASRWIKLLERAMVDEALSQNVSLRVPIYVLLVNKAFLDPEMWEERGVSQAFKVQLERVLRLIGDWLFENNYLYLLSVYAEKGDFFHKKFVNASGTEKMGQAFSQMLIKIKNYIKDYVEVPALLVELGVQSTYEHLLSQWLWQCYGYDMAKRAEIENRLLLNLQDDFWDKHCVAYKERLKEVTELKKESRSLQQALEMMPSSLEKKNQEGDKKQQTRAEKAAECYKKELERQKEQLASAKENFSEIEKKMQATEAQNERFSDKIKDLEAMVVAKDEEIKRLQERLDAYRVEKAEKACGDGEVYVAGKGYEGLFKKVDRCSQTKQTARRGRCVQTDSVQSRDAQTQNEEPSTGDNETGKEMQRLNDVLARQEMRSLHGSRKEEVQSDALKLLLGVGTSEVSGSRGFCLLNKAQLR